MNDFFIKKLKKKRIRSSRTQNFFFQKIKNQNNFFLYKKKNQTIEKRKSVVQTRKKRIKKKKWKDKSQGPDSQVKHASSHNTPRRGKYVI